jgi:hypothetical protein
VAAEQEASWLRRFTKKQGWANGKLHPDAFRCRAATSSRAAEVSVSYSNHQHPLLDDTGKSQYISHFEAFAKQPLGLCVVGASAFECAGMSPPKPDPDESDPVYGHLHSCTDCTDEQESSTLVENAILFKGF